MTGTTVRLPTPTIRGACTGRRWPDWFTTDRAEKHQAKQICETCIVRAHCYQTAVENDESFGIWGGVDFAEPRQNRGLPIRPPVRCPSERAYKKHLADNEEPCAGCKAAHYKYNMDNRNRRKQNGTR